MNKIKLSVLFISVLCFFSGQLNAQDGYTYTLTTNGSNSFSVAAVPNTSSNNFATSVQSYGFTLLIPDGATIDTGSATSLGGAAITSFFQGTDVGEPNVDGYLITETLGSPETLAAPLAGTNSIVFTFTVNGNPSSGELKILENNSSLATSVTELKSFMQADMIDNGMQVYTNVVDPNAEAVSGTSAYAFSQTLSTATAELVGVSLFPNPATDVVKIKGLENSLKSIEVFNIAGQKVLTAVNNLETINVSEFEAGVYFVKLYTEKAHKTIKLLKKK